MRNAECGMKKSRGLILFGVQPSGCVWRGHAKAWTPNWGAVQLKLLDWRTAT